MFFDSLIVYFLSKRVIFGFIEDNQCGIYAFFYQSAFNLKNKFNDYFAQTNNGANKPFEGQDFSIEIRPTELHVSLSEKKLRVH